MLTDQLCNPTPWEVSFTYHRGQKLKVPGDGSIKLTHEQLQDFRKDTPGHEEVRKILETYGLFLLDGERSYDSQAFEAINSNVREIQKRVDEFRTRTQDQRLSIGKPIDEDTMAKLMDSSGYGELERRLELLRKRRDFLRKKLEDSEAVQDRIDPRITCLATDPPRTFPSETALQMFLEENPEVAELHKKLAAALEEE